MYRPFSLANLPSMLTENYLFSELHYETIRRPWEPRRKSIVKIGII